MKTNFCPKCGTSVSNNEKFCPHCGFDLYGPTDKNNNLLNSSSAAKATQRIDPASSKFIQVNNESNSTSENAGHSKKFSIFFIMLMGLGIFIFTTKPWMPRGLGTADQVMRYSNKHDQNILRMRAYGQLDEGLVQGNVDHTINAYSVMKNSKTGTFVFKSHNRYVYLIRIYNNHTDSYWEEIIAVKKDDNDKVYHKQLSKDDMNDIDSNASVAESWTDYQYEEWIN
ncbi:zinc ribbon domain-containing protein [Lacticaseibacillus absianus]|uniref:zinc ribbon domain-containing protein n=1 Tax=Lacticaseibacillus absianus TaxID=2729623 RepID=UPI0015CC2AF2|nr:zinc ribbon domain-containing protein [Lacticaseibacillus absianus]